jgi:hypothetical protein
MNQSKPSASYRQHVCLLIYFFLLVSYATSHIESETECHCSQSYGLADVYWFFFLLLLNSFAFNIVASESNESEISKNYHL